MDLATEADVLPRLSPPNRDLTDNEEVAFPALLAEAGALVQGFLNTTFDPDTNPPPDYVAIVVGRMIARVFNAPDDGTASDEGTSQQSLTAGRFAMQRTYTDGAASKTVWLSKTDKLMLRGSNVVSMQMQSESYAS